MKPNIPLHTIFLATSGIFSYIIQCSSRGKQPYQYGKSEKKKKPSFNIGQLQMGKMQSSEPLDIFHI